MKSDAAKREESVLIFWQREKIFEKSLEWRRGKPEFVFYDGPPFATGLPHTGSLLSSVVKDVFPRYKTMRGYYVRRRWGWDTHGLPIENMVEKDLGLKSKKDIEAIGIEKFNQACRAKVLQYAHDWKEYVDRIGRWVDFDNSYKTMDATYTESVWWALKQMHGKGLLYEGRKVLLYCPHCETPLAKAEIAMDNSYKDVTEEAVTVKFRIKANKLISQEAEIYFLAWTTTPWTLPANVALAVGPEIEYALVSLPEPSLNVREGRVGYVVASALVSKIFGDGVKVEKTFFGKELEKMQYQPLYEIEAVKKTGKRSHYVALADFVSTEEGTGIVHTAVIYGEDDYQLGLKNDLPMVPLLNPNGTYNNQAPEFLRGRYIKKADKMVVEDLEKKGLIFAKALNTHSYPHCYRCGTPLIYNALSSWFINVQKIKKRMLALNEKINWVPEHLKHGRFLNIVENAPDWTISRNRYWASPLPIWKCEMCKRVEVIGSLEELKNRTLKSGNRYFLMRHGKTASNGEGLINDDMNNNDPLTQDGIEEVKKSAESLRGEKIDLIIFSPYRRTEETAEIVADTLGISRDKMLVEARIGEIKTNMTGKTWEEYWPQFGDRKGRLYNRVPGAESLGDVRKRVMEVLYELDAKYKNKNVLLVTHEGVTAMVQIGVIAYADKMDGTYVNRKHKFYKNAEIDGLEFWPFPHNMDFELDFHRPYIDEVKLKCECKGQMQRIPEVVDCWVESGCMPFAEYHYPFENKEQFEKRFPGDFIAEYIAQTRTWFYYMLAVSTALFDRQSFKNVVTTGNILAADGGKMSKSKGNYTTDPLLLMDSFGADALRYSLMSSVVMQAEDVCFRDEDVREAQQRLVNILWNVVVFYNTYGNAQPVIGNEPGYRLRVTSTNILDRWILARLAQLHKEVTENLDKFDTVRASRPIREFVTDFSTWYVRRSRDRFKVSEIGSLDRDQAIATTRFVLLELSKLIAPFMPYLAEQVYKAIGGELESVHLENWSSEVGIKDEVAISEMVQVRAVVELALKLRAESGIKIRQPLSKLVIRPDAKVGLNYASPRIEDYKKLVAEEVNVKEVLVNDSIATEVWLDTTITSDLELEGRMRDLVRQIQDERKEMGLASSDKISVTLPESFSGLTAKFGSELKKAVNSSEITIGPELKIEKI